MSVRLRLTLSYAGFLVAAGCVLVALLLYVIRFVPEGDLTTAGGLFVPDRSDLVDALWPRALQVLAASAVVGLAGGWYLAGYVLRPLQRIHAVAERVRAGDLDDRVRLEGPPDEFVDLAATVDAMLDRLQRTLREQERFAANASHELRTPYAITRSLLDVALADPGAVDVDLLLHRLDAINRRGTEAVEALLVLSTLQGRLGRGRTPVDVAEVTAQVTTDLRPLAEAAGVSLTCRLGEGDVDGSEPLVRQLVTNLVLNALRHNTAHGGHAWVGTRSEPDGAVVLTVVNSGPVVPPDVVGTLTEPFVRGTGRVAPPGSTSPGSASPGSGLGLAIVARVAEAHGADLALRAPSSGGLDVSVRFPPPGT